MSKKYIADTFENADGNSIEAIIYEESNGLFQLYANEQQTRAGQIEDVKTLIHPRASPMILKPINQSWISNFRFQGSSWMGFQSGRECIYPYVCGQDISVLNLGCLFQAGTNASVRAFITIYSCDAFNRPFRNLANIEANVPTSSVIGLRISAPLNLSLKKGTLYFLGLSVISMGGVVNASNFYGSPNENPLAYNVTTATGNPFYTLTRQRSSGIELGDNWTYQDSQLSPQNPPLIFMKVV